MIFDWFENSRRMLKERKPTTDDEWDRRRVWRQEICMLRYLRFNLGKSKAECESAWFGLKGGTRETFDYDPLLPPSKFEQQWRKAEEQGKLEEEKPAIITDGELDYLNSLQAPYPVRKYWLRILIYTKFCLTNSKLPVHDNHVNAYFMRESGIESRPENAAKTIRGWSFRCGIPFPETVLQQGMSVSSIYVPNWIGSGTPVAECRPGDVSTVEKLLSRWTFTCPECGAIMERTRANQSPLCVFCRGRHLRTKRAASYRNSKKVD